MGVKVFETTSTSFEWNGEFDNQILSTGVYFYQVTATNRCGDLSEDGVVHILY